MKVKEFIDYLSHLDQNKDIWISYDSGYGYILTPDCVEVYDDDKVRLRKPSDVKLGDYVFDIS